MKKHLSHSEDLFSEVSRHLEHSDALLQFLSVKASVPLSFLRSITKQDRDFVLRKNYRRKENLLDFSRDFLLQTSASARNGRKISKTTSYAAIWLGSIQLASEMFSGDQTDNLYDWAFLIQAKYINKTNARSLFRAMATLAYLYGQCSNKSNISETDVSVVLASWTQCFLNSSLNQTVFGADQNRIPQMFPNIVATEHSFRSAKSMFATFHDDWNPGLLLKSKLANLPIPTYF